MNTAPADVQGQAPKRFPKVYKTLQSGVEEGIFPGAVFAVSYHGSPLIFDSVGSRTHIVEDEALPLSPLSPDCVYDIGELTIPFVTTSLVLKLAQESRLNLEDRVSRYIQEFGVFGKSKITVSQIMRHISGLPAEVPFYEDLSRANVGARVGILSSRSSREVVLRSINRLKLKHEPGTRYHYSQVGMILLGFLIEALRGQSLDAAAQNMIFRPLRLRSTSYVDTSRLRRQEISAIPEMIAPTEMCSLRKRMLCGEVHEHNAWALGGIAGHAGVFSTAADLMVFCDEILRAYAGQSEFFSSAFVKKSFERCEEIEGPWTCGWATPSEELGLTAAHLPSSARGMVSNTGCAMWLLPEQGVSIVLLTNRLHQSRSDKKFSTFLPKLMSEVISLL